MGRLGKLISYQIFRLNKNVLSFNRHARHLVDIVEIGHVSIQLKHFNLIEMAVKPEDRCNSNVIQANVHVLV